jgi:hypothetical protein
VIGILSPEYGSVIIVDGNKMFMGIGPIDLVILLPAFVAAEIRISTLKSENSGFFILVRHLPLASRIL